jgi:hypothetical protein
VESSGPPVLAIATVLPITTDATSPAGAVVNYTLPAVTTTSGTAPQAVCAPPPGSTFPIGVTTVICSASETGALTVSTSFTVTVVGASGQLSQLLGAVQGVGPGMSLPSKVSAAQSSLAAGDTAATCGILAAFVSEVSAQSGQLIPTQTASALVAEASQIEAVLAC